MHQAYVGVDIHQSFHKAAVIPLGVLQKDDHSWKRTKTLTIHNHRDDFEKLYLSLKEAGDDLAIAVDHTGGHYSAPLVYFLVGKGYHLYYFEGKALREARTRFLDEESKTDEIDAKAMARLLYFRDLTGEEMRISVVAPRLGSIAADLKTLTLQHWCLTKLITQSTNRLHQLLISVFPEGEAASFTTLVNRVLATYPTPASMLGARLAGLRLSASLTEKLLKLAGETVGIPGENAENIIRTLAIQRRDIQQRKDEIDDIICQLVASHPYGRVLLSFPGIGGLGAAVIIGCIGDINHFASEKTFRKALGVYPTVAKSGKLAGKAVMGREGSSEARRVLFQAVFSCLSGRMPDNPFRSYYQRKVDKGMPKKKAIVATMGKLAEVIYHCLREGENYEVKAEAVTDAAL